MHIDGWRRQDRHLKPDRRFRRAAKARLQGGGDRGGRGGDGRHLKIKPQRDGGGEDAEGHVFDGDAGRVGKVKPQPELPIGVGVVVDGARAANRDRRVRARSDHARARWDGRQGGRRSRRPADRARPAVAPRAVIGEHVRRAAPRLAVLVGRVGREGRGARGRSNGRRWRVGRRRRQRRWRLMRHRRGR